jgi:signal transduction histidine kinase
VDVWDASRAARFAVKHFSGHWVRLQRRIDMSKMDTPRGRSLLKSKKGDLIAPADLPHTFERYTKSSDSRGSGLGLVIAKDLVEAHGGQISAQSEVGQGTTITFTLPA